MANFNDLPSEASPQLTDLAFLARGSLSGAERKSTLAAILALVSNISGNAATATALQTARSINGTSFNGTADISITVSAASGITGLGTGVATALGVNAGGAGAFLVNGGVLGTPSSGTATNLTGLPLTTGVTGILPAANGGTANGFVAFSGPATSTKTFTLPNATATILTDNAAVTVAQGGTGRATSTTAYGIITAGTTATGALQTVATGTAGQVLTSGGASAVPVWVTSVPVANGGTGRATSTTAYGLLAAGTTATGAQQTLAAGATTEILVGGGASALPVWTTATGSGSPVRGTSPTISGPTFSGSFAGTYTIAGTPTLSGTFAGTPTWSGANIWSAVGRFNGGLGIGALPSSSAMDPNTLLYLTRTGTGGGANQINLGSHVLYTAAPINTEIMTAGLFDATNSGSVTATTGHIVGLIGRAQDTSSGTHPLNGIEGRCIVTGTSNSSAGVWAIGDINNSTATGRAIHAFKGFCQVYNVTTSSPVAQGTTVVYRAYAPTGGDPTQAYAVLGDSGLQIATGGPVISVETAGVKNIRIAHNGTDGDITNSSGNLNFVSTGFVTLSSGITHLLPYTDGCFAGANGFRFTGNFASGTTVLLASSVTPTNNGELMFQATSNTSLTFKYKGSDGVVRSASVTLS